MFTSDSHFARVHHFKAMSSHLGDEEFNPRADHYERRELNEPPHKRKSSLAKDVTKSANEPAAPQERAACASCRFLAFDDARLAKVIRRWDDLSEQSRDAVAKLCELKINKPERR